MVSQGMENDLKTFLDKVEQVYIPAQIVATPTGEGGLPLFVMFLGALVTALGAFLIFLELLIRDAAVYVAVNLGPAPGTYVHIR